MTHSTPAAAIQVLVVEDDPVARRAHGTYVGRVPGFEVAGSAGSASEAMRLLSELAVDLVLLDMNLPDGHGLDILRALRAAGHSCDVIAVTAARDAAVSGARPPRASRSTCSSRSPSPPSAPGSSSTRPTARACPAPRASSPRRTSTGSSARARPRAPRRPSRRRGSAPRRFGSQAVRAASAPCSAGEVAAAVGASRVTARRYLEYLADEGVVTRSIRYGGRGRPEVQYAPAAPSGR